MSNATRRRGLAFTLIELLVVVAIIMVLIAILLPSLGTARRQARAVGCLSNLKQIGLSCLSYQDEYRVIPNGGTDGSSWVPIMYKYIYNRNIVSPWYGVATEKPPGLVRTVFECPDILVVDSEDLSQRGLTWSGPFRSYGLNGFMADFDSTTYDRTGQLTRPYAVALFADVYASSSISRSSVARRHPPLTCNVVYADGHAEATRLESAMLLSDTSYANKFWGRTKFAD